MEEIHYILKPEPVGFNISTLDLQVQYCTAHATVQLEVQLSAEPNETHNYHDAKVTFETVAEIRCVSMNFFESNYTNSEVVDIKEGMSKAAFWKAKGYCADSGFYSVVNSSLLDQKRQIYDPSDSLSLVHYVIVGYDSYVEIVAGSYTYTVADRSNVYVGE